MRILDLAVGAAVLGIAFAGSAVIPTPASAHHSFAMFDETKSVPLEGTVKKFEWANPHSWLYLEVTAVENMAEEWVIELPSAGALAQQGWNPGYVRAGDRIAVRINPLVDGMKGGSLQSFRCGPNELCRIR